MFQQIPVLYFWVESSGFSRTQYRRIRVDQRRSEFRRGLCLKTTSLSSCLMWTEDLGGRKNQGELTSRLRGHVCLFAACSSFPPPPISRALPPPPPPSPPWWLLLILLLLLLVHVCVPTSLGVLDKPCDVPTTAFTSPPHFHNSLLPPCSPFATAVIFLCIQQLPWSGQKKQKFSVSNSQAISDSRPQQRYFNGLGRLSRIFPFTLGCCCSALALSPSLPPCQEQVEIQTLLCPTCCCLELKQIFLPIKSTPSPSLVPFWQSSNITLQQVVTAL